MRISTHYLVNTYITVCVCMLLVSVLVRCFKSRSRIWSFYVAVLQRTAKKCTTSYNARAQSLFCLLNLLFGDRRSHCRRHGDLHKLSTNANEHKASQSPADQKEGYECRKHLCNETSFEIENKQAEFSLHFPPFDPAS